MEVKNIEKIKITKSIIFQISIFSILTIIAYFILVFKYNDTQEQVAILERQQTIFNKNSKNVTLDLCNVQGVNYTCVKIHNNQPTLTTKNGDTFALTKR